jgi:hypothetical protein
MRRTTKKTRKIQGKQDVTTNTVCMPMFSYAETIYDQGRASEAEEEGATPTDESAFICYKHGRTASRYNPSIAEEAALLPRFEGAVQSDDGTLTLELKL